MKPMDNENLKGKLDVFEKLSPPYARMQEEVWDAITQKIDQSPKGRTVLFGKAAQWYSVAASLVLLIGALTFMRLYTTHVIVPAGQLVQVNLPDGSMVSVNAGSQLHYRPYWWYFNRKVQLSGEAFFKVVHGNTFTVETGLVNTSVLGTSFNVYARNQKVSVTCVTGSVKVESTTEQVFLKPHDKVDWAQGKIMASSKVDNLEQADAWTRSEFYYQGVGLGKVIEDVSLQYGIEITLANGVNIDTATYSGYFKKDTTVENVLNLVGKPFGLTPVKVGEKVFQLQHGH